MRRATALLTLSIGALLASAGSVSSAVAAPDSLPAADEPSARHLRGAAPASSSTLPGPPVDPVLRLLADRGLLTEAAPTDGAPRPALDAEAGVGARSGDSRLVDRFRSQASDMVLTAMNFLGVPYRRGGVNADHGFDCSGFTRHVFEMSLGRVLPRRADEQATTAGLLRIDRDQLKPGDLVFFNTMRRTFSHVGIYVGAGKFIHAPKPGGEVRVDDLQASYWDKRYTGGRRAEPVGTAAPVDPAVTVLPSPN